MGFGFEKANIGTRHLMPIENEGKLPSFKVLYKLVRVLDILSDSIFIRKSRPVSYWWTKQYVFSIVVMSAQ